jgi:hypothetical protein
MKTNDGGPAFPHVMSHCQTANESEMYPGLSLRDYFAAAALTGILSNVQAMRANPPLLHAERAEAAYKAADAMLAEREKVVEGS